MQVIHAVVQVGIRWREGGSREMPRGARTTRRGMPRRARTTRRGMLRRARTTRRGIRNLGKLIRNAKQPVLQILVVILKIRTVICISFSIREQTLNIQARRTVWFGSRLRLCVLEHFLNEFKHAEDMSKLSKFCKNIEMHKSIYRWSGMVPDVFVIVSA